MNDATAAKLSRLRGSYDCASEDRRRFAADLAEARARLAAARAEDAGEGRIQDALDEVADAEDELVAAARREARARESLAVAEAGAGA